MPSGPSVGQSCAGLDASRGRAPQSVINAGRVVARRGGFEPPSTTWRGVGSPSSGESERRTPEYVWVPLAARVEHRVAERPLVRRRDRRSRRRLRERGRSRRTAMLRDLGKRLVAPMTIDPSRSSAIPRMLAMRASETSTRGSNRRCFKLGRRSVPPAIGIASGPSSPSSSTASSTLSGSRSSNAGSRNISASLARWLAALHP